MRQTHLLRLKSDSLQTKKNLIIKHVLFGWKFNAQITVKCRTQYLRFLKKFRSYSTSWSSDFRLIQPINVHERVTIFSDRINSFSCFFQSQFHLNTTSSIIFDVTNPRTLNSSQHPCLLRGFTAIHCIIFVKPAALWEMNTIQSKNFRPILKSCKRKERRRRGISGQYNKDLRRNNGIFIRHRMNQRSYVKGMLKRTSSIIRCAVTTRDADNETTEQLWWQTVCSCLCCDKT